MRLSEARLHAESSIDMYSEHGFEALIRPVFGSVCQELIVVSYWTPGSAHSQAAAAIWRRRSRASTASSTAPSVRAVRLNSSSLDAACTRTRALRSSLALHQMNSSMSGWSTSRTTIFAARRVLPPDLIVPAEASAPRMNETGPEA